MKRFNLLVILLFILGITIAQQSSETQQLLNCLVDEHLPPDPAKAEEGGYLFEYQSIRGATEDERMCTLYRLRNTPDKPPMPVRWTQGDEVLMDKTRLARCPADTPACPWVSVAKYFEGSIDTNLSVISYGLNADAYSQQAETFLSHLSPDESRETQSVGTEIQGTFGAVSGEAVEVHLIVKSRIEPNAAGAQVAILELTDLSQRDDLASGNLRVEWDALTDISASEELLRSAAPDEVMGIVVDQLGGGTIGETDGSISRTPQMLEIRFPIESYELRSGYWLSVYYRDEAEPLVTVEMPAFVPLGTLP